MPMVLTVGILAGLLVIMGRKRSPAPPALDYLQWRPSTKVPAKPEWEVWHERRTVAMQAAQVASAKLLTAQRAGDEAAAKYWLEEHTRLIREYRYALRKSAELRPPTVP